MLHAQCCLNFGVGGENFQEEAHLLRVRPAPRLNRRHGQSLHARWCPKWLA